MHELRRGMGLASRCAIFILDGRDLWATFLSRGFQMGSLKSSQASVFLSVKWGHSISCGLWASWARIELWYHRPALSALLLFGQCPFACELARLILRAFWEGADFIGLYPRHAPLMCVRITTSWIPELPTPGFFPSHPKQPVPWDDPLVFIASFLSSAGTIRVTADSAVLGFLLRDKHEKAGNGTSACSVTGVLRTAARPCRESSSWEGSCGPTQGASGASVHADVASLALGGVCTWGPGHGQLSGSLSHNISTLTAAGMGAQCQPPSFPTDFQHLKPRGWGGKKAPVPKPTFQLYILPLPASPSASTFRRLLLSQDIQYRDNSCYPEWTFFQTRGQTTTTGSPSSKTARPQAQLLRPGSSAPGLQLGESLDTPCFSFLRTFLWVLEGLRGATVRGERCVRSLLPSCFLGASPCPRGVRHRDGLGAHPLICVGINVPTGVGWRRHVWESEMVKCCTCT